MRRSAQRLGIVGIATCLALVTVATQLDAQDKSTWQRIMETKKLRVGAAPAEPWYFKDTTGSPAPGAVKSGGAVWRGVGPAVGKELADAMGVEVEIVETTWGNAVAGLQAGQFDVIFLLDGTPKRAVAVDFVPVPLLWYPIVVLGKEDLKVQAWRELNEPRYKIGTVLGSSMDQFLTKNAPKATISRFQNNNEVLAAFQSGRVDGIVVVGPFAELARARINNMGKIVVPKPAAALAAGTAIRYDLDGRWKDYLTTSIQYFYTTGQIQEIYNQFLEFRGIDPKTATPILRENW
jgi:polar amino acid transport system substrate-binding protein